MAAPAQSLPAACAPARSWSRWLFPAGVALGLIAYWALGGPASFSLEALQARREELQAWVDANFFLALVAFAGVATVGTAFCLPVTSVLCLTAGTLFGAWLGTGLISASTTLGATCAFLMTRYLFHDFVQQGWGGRLRAINRGLERDGAYYLFSIRLVPIAPFFLVNALMGLTPIRTGAFWWATQLGMLPLLAIGTFAGTNLPEIRQASDILSPPVLLSLALLALVPVALRFLVARPHSRPDVQSVPLDDEKTFSPLPQRSEGLS